MPRRQFKITELRQTASGTFTELPNQFVWNADGQSSPRGEWDFALKLRTVREDYVGTSIPTEQVLGYNFEPFTLEGIWDDKYNQPGFAQQMRRAMEALVSRGNLVRLELEDINVVGLITNLRIKYRTSFRIGYAFTVSPHFRENGRGDTVAPRAVSNPDDYAVQAQAIVDQAQDIQDEAPSEYMTGTLFPDVSALVADWQDRLDTISSIVSNRVILVQDNPRERSVSSVARLAQAFTDLGTSAGSVMTALANSPTSTSLSYQGGLNTLQFAAWSRGLGFQARALRVLSAKAAAELRLRVDPTALALYRPSAGESLYAISNRFYNTPHRWRDIYERNGLFGLTLTGTETLIIPQARTDRAGG